MTAGAFAIAVEGATLFGERRDGVGVPLVLVHGFGGSRRDWDRVIAALPPHLPLVTYDQRGFGASAASAGMPFSYAEDLLALLDGLGIEQADLCGMSLGGATVLGAALTASARVAHLVLVSPMLAGWSWSAEWVALWKAIGRAARAGEMETARALWWRHPLFATVRDTLAGVDLRHAIGSFGGQQWIRDDQRDDGPMVDRLHALAVPTLLLTGMLDLPDFRLMADLIEGSAHTVTRIDHEDAGHMLALEQPGAIAAAITGFLGAGSTGT